MDFQLIMHERRGRVGIITLNRPEKLNAWSPDMRIEVLEALAECVRSPDIGAIVITGAGRAYCAGADVRRIGSRPEPAGQPDLQAERNRAQGDGWTSYVLTLPKPTITAFNGTAVGVGVTHTLPMDFRIASDSARFGLSFVKLGISPELGSSALLPRMVGTARALDWCLTGRLFSAQEALSAGLVTEVHPADSLLDRAMALGEGLCDLSPRSLLAIRTLLRSNQAEPELQRVLDREADALLQLFETPEHKESVRAFIEKRPPVFSRGTSA
jgi:enoyl-CoA hydratase/carnithine racemase